MKVMVRPLEERSDDCEDNQSQEIKLLGGKSIFSVFYVDESLLCSSPVEKHLYEVLPPSVTQSPPCFYCGETDLVRTSVLSENEYPLCHHCRTVKKFGPVLKRKRRTIVPRKQKPKNKKRKQTIELFEEEESDQGQELFDGDEREVSDYQKQLEDNFGVEDEEEENSPNPSSSPVTRESLVSVEDLLAGED